RRIDGDVVAVRRKEFVDVRYQGAGKFLEHQVLVLHLGAEPRRLEQALAVPLQGREVGRNGRDGREQPLVQEGQVAGRQDHGLGVIDQTVVLGMEYGVDGREADVLVRAAVAGDIV